jgi:hypothetical protein
MKLPHSVAAPLILEGSRPRDPLLPKPSVFHDRGRKYTFGFSHVFAAREDARPPVIAAGRQVRIYTP